MNTLNSISIANDHGGYELKSFIVEHFKQKGWSFTDFGTDSAESVDYPDYAHRLAEGVSNGTIPQGILICGSGNGIQMTANKHPHVRAALCWNAEIARLARSHNNANILVLPGRFIDFEEALKCVEIFFSTPFEGGRHEARVRKIDL